MAISAQILTPANRELWLAQRSLVVGASEIAALFGESPWMSPFKLSAIKAGLVKTDEENAAMRRGRLLEPVAIECVREENPTWDVSPNTFPDLQYFVDAPNRIGATPDAFVKIPGRWGRGIIQIKSVAQSSFTKRWDDRPEDREQSNGFGWSPPTYVALQASVECAITDSQYTFVAALVIGHGIDLHLQEIPLTPGLYSAAAARSLAFWEKIDRGETYAPSFDKDGSLIREIYADAAPGKEIDLSQDNEILELAENDRILRGVEWDTLAARKEIKARLLYKMKGAEVAMFNGEVIATAKTISKKGYVVKPSKYRQVSFKEKTE